MNQLITGQYIARKRKEKNMTQAQLAEKLGVSNKAVSKWETGKCMTDYSVVEALCGELEITVAELMDGENAADGSIRAYDDAQIVELLRRTQELARQKNIRSPSYSYGNACNILPQRRVIYRRKPRNT